LHLLNLCTTLTPATATDRYHNHPASKSLHLFGEAVPSPVRKVDITSPAISEILASLAALEEDNSAAPDRAARKDIDVEIIVRVSPPLHVRIIREDDPQTADALFESFMESWTRLVGDEVVSKWIVLVLAVSVALNGYLLKGIAAGSNGARPAPSQAVRFGSDTKPEVLSFPRSPISPDKPAAADAINLAKRSDTVATVDIMPVPILAPKPIFAKSPDDHSLNLNLDKVDLKLKAQNAQEKDHSLSSLSNHSSSDVVTRSSDSGPGKGTVLLSSSLSSCSSSSSVVTRSLEECVDIFENGPRPVSVSLSMLNDEEVILLVQSGKIAAYALEKMLGDNERAVLIRRALICECPINYVKNL
jgi:hydroxymethylglutaryl-CoA reductase (NADPH)